MTEIRTAACASWLVLTVMGGAAFAHSVGISQGDYRVVDSRVIANVIFAQPELALSVPGLDTDGDGTLSAREVARGSAAIEQTIVTGIRVGSPTEFCVGVLESAKLVEQDGVLIRIVYSCRTRPETLKVDVAVLEGLSFGHRHMATATAGARTVKAVAYRGNAGFTMPVPAQIAGGAMATIRPLFVLGLQRMLSSYESFLFLLAMLLVAGRLRALMPTLAAFAAAYSFALCASAFGIWTPSARVIQPIIALSIAYLAVENLFLRDDSGRRWIVTFPFGMAYGFGLAGALSDAAMPAADLPAAVAAFDVGVLAGLTAVLAVALPLMALLRRQTWFAGFGAKVASGALAIAGVWWFAVRTL